MHVHVPGGGKGAQRAERGRTHGRTKRLLVVDAGDLCASLNTESSLELTAAFDLVNPNEFDEAAAMRDLAAVDL